MDSLLRKLLWTIVAIAAMVLLAPLSASAHEGHAGPGAGVRVAAHQHASGHVGVVEPGARQAVAQPSASGDCDHNDLCTSGCCFGMGCCAGVIVSAAPDLDPPCGPPALIPHAPHPLASAGLVSPIEPPEVLA